MHKPELSEYHLSQSEVDRAQNADFRRHALQQKFLPWLLIIGPLLVGIQIYSVESSVIPAAVIGMVGGGILALPGGALLMGLWDALWARANRLENEILQRYKKYRAALKIFEEHQQRQLKIFWMNLSGRAFECELGKLFERLGYSVCLTRYGKDGGVDIFLSTGNKSTIVQCKRYTGPVGVAVVRELYGVLLSLKADAAILASTGGFTRGVEGFARGKPIQLLGLGQIIELHKSAGSSGET